VSIFRIYEIFHFDEYCSCCLEIITFFCFSIGIIIVADFLLCYAIFFKKGTEEKKTGCAEWTDAWEFFTTEGNGKEDGRIEEERSSAGGLN